MRVQKEREREGDVMGLFEQVERVGPVRNTIYGGFWETRVMPVEALKSPSCRSAARMLTYVDVCRLMTRRTSTRAAYADVC